MPHMRFLDLVSWLPENPRHAGESLPFGAVEAMCAPTPGTGSRHDESAAKRGFWRGPLSLPVRVRHGNFGDRSPLSTRSGGRRQGERRSIRFADLLHGGVID